MNMSPQGFPLWATRVATPSRESGERPVAWVGLVVGWVVRNANDTEPAPVVVTLAEDDAASVWRSALRDEDGERVAVTVHLTEQDARAVIPPRAISDEPGPAASVYRPDVDPER